MKKNTTPDTDRVTRIKRSMARCTAFELTKLKWYCDERARTVGKVERAAAADACWQWVKRLAIDSELHVTYNGIKLGGPPLIRGDVVTVISIQPRKRVLWVRMPNGKYFGFYPSGVLSYDLRVERPADMEPPTQAQRNMAARWREAGAVLTNAMNKEASE